MSVRTFRKKNETKNYLHKKLFIKSIQIPFNDNTHLTLMDSNHILAIFEEYILLQVITSEQKKTTIHILKFKTDDATGDYGMNLDQSLLPETYWHLIHGTEASSVSESGESDTMEVSENEAETIKSSAPDPEPSPMIGAVAENVDVSSTDCNTRFIKYISATMGTILDARNIQNLTPEVWAKWPRFRKEVLYCVFIAIGVPNDIAIMWISQAPHTAPVSLEELQLQQQLRAAEEAARQLEVGKVGEMST